MEGRDRFLAASNDIGWCIELALGKERYQQGAAVTSRHDKRASYQVEAELERAKGADQHQHHEVRRHIAESSHHGEQTKAFNSRILVQQLMRMSE